MITLETDRLILRPYNSLDRTDLVALFTDREVRRYVGDGVLSDEAAGAGFERIFTHVYAPRAFDVWAVISKREGRFAGHAEIEPRRDEGARAGDLEIIYVLNRAHWGFGLATELARGILDYGFRELKPARIVATVDAENCASIRVLEKLGMTYGGEFKDEHGTTLVMAIDAGDYET